MDLYSLDSRGVLGRARRYESISILLILRLNGDIFRFTFFRVFLLFGFGGMFREICLIRNMAIRVLRRLLLLLSLRDLFYKVFRNSTLLVDALGRNRRLLSTLRLRLRLQTRHLLVLLRRFRELIRAH